ncbi:L-fucose:H+ symporter permease [Jiulongibacter sediminis]|uniref:Major facilitator transporter n=1 Tax=Jiulongibacter sediminis TaxID=1605367 RepID=A0A0P7C5N5_9BACT|nr:L-fucose:H+ symporter permease [Jiulongibacter sediminis]KPM48629.1 major facilitator transporter [Jiulongibacter sediminis]TBX25167.1 major facilitator transporter [Jiulongibacter sediminis]
MLKKTPILPFILTTSLFALWGFANDITNPLVKAFGTIFNQSQTVSTFVQVAFYGGYCLMAIPAAIFIKKYTYKKGLLIGLALYGLGCLAFIPAAQFGLFQSFLIAYFIMTCGLSFLETSANPYILAMGEEESSTQRLNLAQSFNPIGSITGAYIATNFILAKMNKLGTAERAALPKAEFESIKMADLEVVKGPYVIIGFVLVVMFILFLIYKMPEFKEKDTSKGLDLKGTFKRLFANARYREGVIAQTFYVGAQITMWTFIVQYGTGVFMEQGISEVDAAEKSSGLQIFALMLFAGSRFVFTYLMKFFKPGLLLMILSILAVILLIPVLSSTSQMGLYCIIGVSGCMSLMFPTIYGIALKGVGDDAKLGAAGLVAAIGGGALIPLIQANIIDNAAVSISFVVPLICFIVIAIYGRRAYKTFAV